MPAHVNPFSVVFPDWYNECAAYEAAAKGWLHGVEVHLDDGSRIQLEFYDPVRLQQTIDDDLHAGRTCFAIPGLIVIPDVTTAEIQRAVAELFEAGFFRPSSHCFAQD